MKRTAKKLLGLLLTVVLVAGMLPAGTVALAADEATETITFVGQSSNVDVNKITSYGSNGQNANWMFFDWSGDWAEKAIRGSSSSNSNTLRARAGGTTYTSWMAFKIDFETLTTGKYSLSMSYAKDASTGTNGGTPSATFWFAKADTLASAADYKTDANRLGTVTSFSGSNVIGEDIIIDDADAEYVLVMELQSDIRLNIADFTFTRTGDLPTAGGSTEETFSFENGLTNGNTLEANHSEYSETKNPNWKFFDKSSDYDTYANYKQWAGNCYRSDSRNGGKSFVKIADAYKSGTVDIADAWTALKLDPQSSLQTGTYQLSFDLLSVGNAREDKRTNRQMAVYFAEYDSSKTTGAQYKTDANQIMPLTVVVASETSPATVTAPTTVNITNPDAEYVLIIELEGAEIWLTDFTLTRTGDIQEVAPATEETFTFNGATNATRLYDGSYDTTGTANPNWTYFDRAASFKAETNNDYAGFAGLFYKAAKYSGYGFLKLADWDSVGGTQTWTALKLAPQKLQTGEYKLTFDLIQNVVQNRDSHGDRQIAVYLAEYVDGQNNGAYYITEANLIKPLGTVSTTNAGSDSYIADIGSFHITNSDAEYVLIIEVQGAEMWLHDFTIARVGDTPASGAKVAFSKNPLRLGEVGGAALTIDGKKVISSDITFSTTDDAVIVTKAGTITPKESGEATITATCGDITADATITVLTDELLSGTVSVYVNSLVNGVASKTGIDGVVLGNINAVARGKSITLTATGIDGKEFKYWQLASGIILSEEESYTFNANSNTAIFGVYESEEDAADGADVTIRFFNGFGGFIQKVVKAKGTPFSEFASAVTDKNYRGYAFESWMNADDSITDETAINKNDVVVAQYAENPAEIYEVTGIINPGYYAYDAVVTAVSTDANFSYWTRNGEIVSYNPTYTFSVWGDTNVVAVCDGAKTAEPTVILDSEDGLYMTEYSLPEGYIFIEAGIVFSDSGTPSINSCTSKASSKKLSGLHGQFTAKPSGNETIARGYVIYKDVDGHLIASYAD